MINVIQLKAEPFKLLWANDVHMDSVHCKREQFIRDCKEADKIIISGDFWDCMEGFGDRRASSKDPEIRKHYINGLIELGVKVLTPFKDKIIGWNGGNHELSFGKFSDVDLTDLVCQILGINPPRLGMRGYYVFNFDSGKPHAHSQKIYFQHNSGSNGKRSKGSLAADLLAGEHPTADMWITEHSHRGTIVPIKAAELTNVHTLKYVNKFFANGITYKAADEAKEGDTFEQNKALGMCPIGGLIIEFKLAPEIDRPNNRHRFMTMNPYFKL
ncbi:hypothetical protein [Massilibacteroides sp.]|uniref:hypothetical protein n=1 Tax=Massilibacteroides sp. TaxID=2034766 RepID=UPI002636B99F|nr:hypothetical protein [Massilibacteroides sp.]MDD4515628.1 hypothetical protein [Massilibacteroides sp.]